jgi:hypothetical protein
MKAGMIFARKTTWRSRLDLEYLDETSSRKVSARQQHDDAPKRTRSLRQFADYASKETLGSRGRIPAPPDPDQRGRQPDRAVSIDQRRTQEAHFGGLVRAHPEISNLLAESREKVREHLAQTPCVPVSFTFAQERAKRLLDLLFVGMFRPVAHYANEVL